MDSFPIKEVLSPTFSSRSCMLVASYYESIRRSMTSPRSAAESSALQSGKDSMAFHRVSEHLTNGPSAITAAVELSSRRPAAPVTPGTSHQTVKVVQRQMSGLSNNRCWF